MNLLPITPILPDILAALNQHSNVVLQAPPGAGKSTLLPLHILHSGLVSNGQIWLLEPRRLAAENVARRLSESLNEPLGQSIGLMTGDFSQVSAQNKIVVMTEGILIQRLLTDNAIESCGLIVFDEFHERNLETDLGLALAMQCQQFLREDLRLLVMSATLAPAELCEHLDAKLLVSDGRSYPVTIHYQPATSQHSRDIQNAVVRCIEMAIKQHHGDILVFLPGQKEIRFIEQSLSHLTPQQFQICPLHGQLNWQAQQQAIKPTAKDKNIRKIILATDIAKTSLTIEGVTVVIDSGLERLAQYNVKTAMDELVTVKASQASMIQRAGRAGRVQAGDAYRILTESEFNSREAFSPLAIERTDLAQFSLSLACWGSLDLSEYCLLTAPEKNRLASSIELLQQLAILNNQQLTPHGEQLKRLPIHPRFAHMIMLAKQYNLAKTACYLAAILSEGDPLQFDMQVGMNSDLTLRLSLFEAHKLPNFFEGAQVRVKQALRIEKLAKRLCKQLNIEANKTLQPEQAGLLTCLAYPDRLAQARGKGYRLRSGQGCQVHPQDALKNHDFLAVAHVSNNENTQAGRQTFIRLAANIALPDILKLCAEQITEQVHYELNGQQNLQQICEKKLGQLVLATQQTPAKPEQLQDYYLQCFQQQGLAFLPLPDHSLQLIARLTMAHQFFESEYPSYSETALISDIENWLSPFLTGKKLKDVDYQQALLSRLPYSLQTQLKQDFPQQLLLPSGRMVDINYRETPPTVSAKLQEFFGMQQSPTVARGRIKLNCHLLSPAQKPLAMSHDLAFFWKEAYPDVRKENRGRYAKHPWPEDPLTAVASAFTKKRMENIQSK